MELNSYQKLETLSLPHPKVYKLEELIEENSPQRWYYLRYHQKTTLPLYATSAELNQRANDFRKFVTEQNLIQIEQCILSQIGGCAVTQGSRRYIELVAGHLSGLLLNGWCQIRVYLDGKTQHTRLENQDLMIDQEIQGNRALRATRLKAELVDKLINSAEKLVAAINSNLLFEFIVDSKNQICFVDTKDYPWLVDFYAVVSTNYAGGFVYKNESLGVKSCQIYEGSFELENLHQIDTSTIIHLGSHAALSHFVTRSLRKGIAGIQV